MSTTEKLYDYPNQPGFIRFAKINGAEVKPATSEELRLHAINQTRPTAVEYVEEMPLENDYVLILHVEGVGAVTVAVGNQQKVEEEFQNVRGIISGNGSVDNPIVSVEIPTVTETPADSIDETTEEVLDASNTMIWRCCFSNYFVDIDIPKELIAKTLGVGNKVRVSQWANFRTWHPQLGKTIDVKVPDGFEWWTHAENDFRKRGLSEKEISFWLHNFSSLESHTETEKLVDDEDDEDSPLNLKYKKFAKLWNDHNWSDAELDVMWPHSSVLDKWANIMKVPVRSFGDWKTNWIFRKYVRLNNPELLPSFPESYADTDLVINVAFSKLVAKWDDDKIEKRYGVSNGRVCGWHTRNQHYSLIRDVSRNYPILPDTTDVKTCTNHYFEYLNNQETFEYLESLGMPSVAIESAIKSIKEWFEKWIESCNI